jgi:hypothetical protein
MEEERENDNKASSRDQGDSAGGWAGQRQELNLSSAYATLLDQYRDAVGPVSRGVGQDTRPRDAEPEPCKHG